MVAWAERAIARGSSVRSTAKALNVDPRALGDWLRDAVSSSVALVPVEIVEPASTTGPTVSVVSPTGYRIEGLTLDAAVAVLARLR